MSGAEVEAMPVEETENKFSGVKLPSSRVDRMLRKKFADKRIASATPKYVTAVVEAVLEDILKRAGESAKVDGKKRATLVHLMRAVRADRASAKLFRAYVFASNNQMKFDSMALLNSNDREVAMKKRKEAKLKKSESAVPSIDQE